MAFAPLIIARFVNNICIFSPLNISFITINITITEIIAITNIKILNAKWSKIEVPMKISFSFSLSKVSCCLSKDIFFCLYLSTNSLNVFGTDSNSSSKSFDFNGIGKTCFVSLYYGEKEYPKYLLIHQNNLEMLYLPQNTSLNQYRLSLDRMLQ